MSHYLREHLEAVGELPQKLRETMTSIGLLDDRVQSISALIDADIGEVARARQRYYAQFDCPDDEDKPQPRTSRVKVHSRYRCPFIILHCCPYCCSWFTLWVAMVLFPALAFVIPSTLFLVQKCTSYI